MYTLTLQELGLSEKKTEFTDLFSININSCETGFELSTYIKWICDGSRPSTCSFDSDTVRKLNIDYVNVIVEKNSNIGIVKQTFKSILHSFSRKITSEINISNIAIETGLDRSTVSRYLNYLYDCNIGEELFV
jgi:DNA-binding transcriptional ArsR family regulator